MSSAGRRGVTSSATAQPCRSTACQSASAGANPLLAARKLPPKNLGPRRYDGTKVTAAAIATYHAIATPAAMAMNRGSVRAAMASAQAGTTIEPPMTTNCTALAAIAPSGAP